MLPLLLVLFALPLAGLVLLELYGRLRPQARIRYVRNLRSPWHEVPAPNGERRWRCRLPFANSHRKDQGLLLGIEPRVEWLLRKGAGAPNLTTRTLLHHPYGRRDGYFEAVTVEPGQTEWVEMEICAAGAPAELEALSAALVTLRYRTYTRHSDERHEAALILSAGAPSEAVAAREKHGHLMYPILTHLLTDQDDLAEVIQRYTGPIARPGDTVVLVESAVAIAQGRYYTPAEIAPGWLATRLCHFFPLKGSLGTRYTLQALMNEHGTLRVLLAALAGFAAKAAGVSGLFYRLAGEQARLIDDLSGTLPPFDRFVVLGPADCDAVVRDLEARTGLKAAIVDANDGGEAFVLGASAGVDIEALQELMRLNPQGNDDQQTPLVVVRWNGAAREHVA